MAQKCSTDRSGTTVAGSKSFSTYSGFLGGLQQPGIGMRAVDIVAGLWTPDQTWTYSLGDTFASRGFMPGTYTVADIVTGEFITIQIGDTVPEPATLLLLGTGLGAVAVRRRLKKRA